MLTAVLLCHQFPFKWWKDSERRPAFGKKPLYTSLQARQLRCQVHNRRHQFSDILKNFANKWSRTATGKSKTSTMLPLLIDDKYRRNVFISLAVFLSFRGHFSFFLTNSLVRNLPMWLHFCLKVVIQLTLSMLIVTYRLAPQRFSK